MQRILNIIKIANFLVFSYLSNFYRFTYKEMNIDFFKYILIFLLIFFISLFFIKRSLLNRALVLNLILNIIFFLIGIYIFIILLKYGWKDSITLFFDLKIDKHFLPSSSESGFKIAEKILSSKKVNIESIEDKEPSNLFLTGFFSILFYIWYFK